MKNQSEKMEDLIEKLIYEPTKGSKNVQVE